MEVTLGASDLALVWKSVDIARSTDEQRPLLTGVLVEYYPGRGCRLTATDSYILITGWVPEAGGDPDEMQEAAPLLELPSTSAVVADPKGHISKFMDWALKDAKDYVKCGEAEPQIKLAIGDDLRSGFVLDGMASTVATFEAPLLGKRFKTTTIEGSYPDWRNLLPDTDGTDGDATQAIGFGSNGILRLGKLAAIWGAATMELSFAGPLSPVHFAIRGGTYEQRMSAVEVEGLGMPVKLSSDAEGIVRAMPSVDVE
jgi:hypothetical protein